MISQRQIRNLLYQTVSEAELGGRLEEICYVFETKTFYEFVISGSAYVVNHTSVLSTQYEGNTRWVAKSGKYFSMIYPIENQITSTPPSLALYVDGNRDDLYTPDATSERPYKSIQNLIDDIQNNSDTNHYNVCILPGQYIENLTLKPYISLVGFFKEGTLLRGTGGGTHSCSFPNGGNIGFKNISFGSPGQKMEFTHPTSASDNVSISFDNCSIGDVEFNMLGSGVDTIQMKNDTVISGYLKVHSSNLHMFNSNIMGVFECDDNGSEHDDVLGNALSLQLKDDIIDSLICRGNALVNINNCNMITSLTSDGALCLVKYDSQSAPENRSDIISINGGIFQRLNNSWSIKYDSSSSSLTTDNIESALDELAARLDAHGI